MNVYLDDLFWLAVIVPVVLIVLIAGVRIGQILFKGKQLDKWLVFVGIMMALGSLYMFSQSLITALGPNDWYPVGALAMLLAGLLCTFLPMFFRKQK